MKKHIFLLLLLAMVSCGQPTSEEQTETEASEESLPEKTGAVNDFENLLDSSAVDNLEQKVAEVETSTGYSIVLATVGEIPHDTDIVGYATHLGNRWEVGTGEESNGIMIVLSEKVGSVAIAPGKGLEEVFNDTITQRIIDQYMIPYFREGNFHDGLYSALNEIRKVAKAEDSSAPPDTGQ